MKKALVTMVLVLALSALPILGAFAGPLIGLQIAPVRGAAVGFLAGWEFDYLNLEVVKNNLADWTGWYTVGAIWTPEDPSGDFGYRAGVNSIWEWTNVGLTYEGLGFVLGVSATWKALDFYGAFNITSTGVITPILGVNFIFDALVTEDAQSDEGP